MATTIRSNNVLDQACDLIDRGQFREALQLIDRSGQRSAAMENARGVCLLRLGQFEQAVLVFRELIFPAGSVCVQPGTPVVYQTNFVTAMLLHGNVFGAKGVLDAIQDRRHPAVLRLKAGLTKWRKTLGLFQRFACLFGAYPSGPVHLDGPLGDL